MAIIRPGALLAISQAFKVEGARVFGDSLFSKGNEYQATTGKESGLYYKKTRMTIQSHGFAVLHLTPESTRCAKQLGVFFLYIEEIGVDRALGVALGWHNGHARRLEHTGQVAVYIGKKLIPVDIIQLGKPERGGNRGEGHGVGRYIFTSTAAGGLCEEIGTDRK